MNATCDQCTATLPHITVAGPGRCTECSFHVATQGHRGCCSGTAPVQADKPAPDNRSFITRLDDWKAAKHPPDSRTLRDLLDKRRGRSPRPQRPAGNVTDIAAPGTNPAYVAAAIRADLNRLAAATTEGIRNTALHEVACNVFEFVKAGHANGPGARDELERIATANGLPHSEIQSTLRSAWKKVGPRRVPAPKAATPAYSIESQT